MRTCGKTPPKKTTTMNDGEVWHFYNAELEHVFYSPSTSTILPTILIFNVYITFLLLMLWNIHQKGLKQKQTNTIKKKKEPQKTTGHLLRHWGLLPFSSNKRLLPHINNNSVVFFVKTKTTRLCASPTTQYDFSVAIVTGNDVVDHLHPYSINLWFSQNSEILVAMTDNCRVVCLRTAPRHVIYFQVVGRHDVLSLRRPDCGNLVKSAIWSVRMLGVNDFLQCWSSLLFFQAGSDVARGKTKQTAS